MNNECLLNHFRGTVSDLAWTPAVSAPRRDDLDLPAMARAALNYLRGNPDPARGYECKFALGPLGIPCHVPISPSNAYGFDVVSLGDTDNRMDMYYHRMRELAGEAGGLDPVEEGIRRRVRGYLREDHLCWVNPGAVLGETLEGEWVSNWSTAKLLYSLSETYARTGDKAVKAAARGILLALKSMALWERNAAFFWGIAPYKDGQWLLRNWCETHGRNYPFIVEPCLRYYECTGDEEGLALARAFAEGFVNDVQPELGERRVDPATGAFKGHVHMHTHAAWGMAHLGALVNEPRYTDWAARVHDYVVRMGTDFGWYPEFSPQREYRTEICVVGDMVALGAWLARGGRPHYWDIVDRTIRNTLRRSQFSLSGAFVDLFRSVHQDQPAAVVDRALADLRRFEGGFVAQATFNDWVSYPDNPKLGTPGLNSNGIHMMGCCSPEGMHGLWEGWDGIVTGGRPDEHFVNLAFSREHEKASVRAFRPEDGRLEVTARRGGTWFLRPPAWSNRSAWEVTRNGQPAPALWGGPAQAYVMCRDVRPGDVLAVTWPVAAFKQSFAAQSVPGRSQVVTTRWVGNRVRAVEPVGNYLPMYPA